MLHRVFLLVSLILSSGFAAPRSGGDLARVKGVTISCNWNGDWARPGFGDELDRLQALGVNWVSIHPYASVSGDGSVKWNPEDLDADSPAAFLGNPMREARARGMGLFIKPHLAYWGSPFRWRGEIEFEGEARLRFWKQYSEWILNLARATRSADSFCIGTELDRMLASEVEWRTLIKAVRGVTAAHLTYAANWDHFEEVPFWDALDVIGVQAYFPLTEAPNPSIQELREGWQPWVERLRALHLKLGKPVVFTELGYDDARHAAARPWEDDGRGRRVELEPELLVLQERCLQAALEMLDGQKDWLRGAFLWKWFVRGGRHGFGRSAAHSGSFRLDREGLHRVIQSAWLEPEADPQRR